MLVRPFVAALLTGGFLFLLSGCHHPCPPCESIVTDAAAPGTSFAWLPATPEKLPRWRGFNLLGEGTFMKNGSAPKFLESDFRMVSELGFNFVRLPLDYRIWIKNNDWEQFDENVLKEIDQAVAWGEKYKLHVCLNFHRAPGYTVASPAEAKSLWTDAEAQRVCAMHWAAFARRYKGIPSARLSFDLLNEPKDVEPKVYAEVVRKLAEAIRHEDPERLIISDGLKGGSAPIPELKDLHVAEATRGYTPGGVSHYLASWAGQNNAKPVPTWPKLAVYGYFYGPAKRELGGALTIQGPFAKAATVRLHVDTVSQYAHLRATADGVAIWDRNFPCNGGAGEWKSSEFIRQYNLYRCVYDADYLFAIPPGTKEVKIEMTTGDWLKATELSFTTGGKETVLPLAGEWGKASSSVTYARRRTIPRWTRRLIWKTRPGCGRRT